jgi:hypothetical protein
MGVSPNFNYQLYGSPPEEIKEDQYEENAESKDEISDDLQSRNPQ